MAASEELSRSGDADAPERESLPGKAGPAIPSVTWNWLLFFTALKISWALMAIAAISTKQLVRTSFRILIYP
jgi:hypothetical protein